MNGELNRDLGSYMRFAKEVCCRTRPVIGDSTSETVKADAHARTPVRRNSLYLWWAQLCNSVYPPNKQTNLEEGTVGVQERVPIMRNVLQQRMAQ